MKNDLKKISIISGTIAAVSILAVAGFFVAILGVFLLPFFMLWKKQSPPMPKSEAPKPDGNIIEADFKRVDKPTEKND